MKTAALPCAANGVVGHPLQRAGEKNGVSLEANDVHKSFDRGLVRALRGVHLRVEPGERLVIMGPTGCGKSTLLALMSLLAQPDSGTITIGGINSHTIRSPERWRATTVGLVFQLHYLLPHLTVQENLALALRPHKLPRKTVAERVSFLLERLALSHRAHTQTRNLSGGERQLAAVARALVNEPRLILADEPTGSVDSETGDRILDELFGWSEQTGATLVVVTHDPRVAQHGQRVVFMRDGRVESEHRK